VGCTVLQCDKLQIGYPSIREGRACVCVCCVWGSDGVAWQYGWRVEMDVWRCSVVYQSCEGRDGDGNNVGRVETVE
jgi:hypothetical protein